MLYVSAKVSKAKIQMDGGESGRGLGKSHILHDGGRHTQKAVVVALSRWLVMFDCERH